MFAPLGYDIRKNVQLGQEDIELQAEYGELPLHCFWRHAVPTPPKGIDELVDLPPKVVSLMRKKFSDRDVGCAFNGCCRDHRSLERERLHAGEARQKSTSLTGQQQDTCRVQVHGSNSKKDDLGAATHPTPLPLG